MRLDGMAHADLPCSSRLLGFIERTRTIAVEYGLHATVGYKDGRPSVTLDRARANAVGS